MQANEIFKAGFNGWKAGDGELSLDSLFFSDFLIFLRKGKIESMKVSKFVYLCICVKRRLRYLRFSSESTFSLSVKRNYYNLVSSF